MHENDSSFRSHFSSLSVFLFFFLDHVHKSYQYGKKKKQKETAARAAAAESDVSISWFVVLLCVSHWTNEYYERYELIFLYFFFIRISSFTYLVGSVGIGSFALPQFSPFNLMYLIFTSFIIIVITVIVVVRPLCLSLSMPIELCVCICWLCFSDCDVDRIPVFAYALCVYWPRCKWWLTR